jgi:hypothetical protein
MYFTDAVENLGVAYYAAVVCFASLFFFIGR